MQVDRSHNSPVRQPDKRDSIRMMGDSVGQTTDKTYRYLHSRWSQVDSTPFPPEERSNLGSHPCNATYTIL